MLSTGNGVDGGAGMAVCVQDKTDKAEAVPGDDSGVGAEQTAELSARRASLLTRLMTLQKGAFQGMGQLPLVRRSAASSPAPALLSAATAAQLTRRSEIVPFGAGGGTAMYEAKYNVWGLLGWAEHTGGHGGDGAAAGASD